MNAYHFRELSVALTQKDKVLEALAHALNIQEQEILNMKVERFSLDCRKRSEPHWSFNVRFETAKNLSETHWLVRAREKEDSLDSDPLKKSVPMPSSVSVIGAGPAGLWATLWLLRRGFSVDLYEQGKPVEERFRDIRKFFVDRKFNAHSNILFGEGGAGAFSDGKLNTRSRNPFSNAVLSDM
ncbi:MAG: FAD-dependent oxidoreductase, partial [Fibrobacteraceae bacterium]|nr:FAD-dependent oxidoreductase [Fibrobacteraceae bacterium]